MENTDDTPVQAKIPAPLLNPNFDYTPAVKTDVTKTWRKFGWVPIAERGNK